MTQAKSLLATDFPSSKRNLVLSFVFLYKEILVLLPPLKEICLTSIPPGQMN